MIKARDSKITQSKRSDQLENLRTHLSLKEREFIRFGKETWASDFLFYGVNGYD